MAVEAAVGFTVRAGRDLGGGDPAGMAKSEIGGEEHWGNGTC